MPAFSKVLVANRGEIACRVLRTARAEGYRTVAVFSEADRHALHVSMADEAVSIGGAPASESYLCIEHLIEAAKRAGAHAVHPGYGFLSENAAFAEACAQAGLVFVGPPPSAIRVMGDKALAKARMRDAGVPTAPGYLGEDQSLERLTGEARRIGFPLLVKATAGGGGRGIRAVQSEGELVEAVESARREAESAFGDSTLMLERAIGDARHIEVQVFADAHGNVIHLGERDCTAQRRRQKVIEEAPSVVVDAALRARMGEAAVAAARAVGYRGAGTVEFIVDAEGNYYFLEMNTRLQVEHPVTELITGLDLVAWQLMVAAGEPLPLKQEEVVLSGHAIEARLYAEDPYAGFSPQSGRALHFRPDERTLPPGVRVDHGLGEGGTVTPYYDAMVAKFIAHGRTREMALRRLVAALEDVPLLGVRNNARFLVDLLRSEDFRAGRMTTERIDAWAAEGAALLKRPAVPEEAFLVAALLMVERGAWFRNSGSVLLDLTLRCADERRALKVERKAPDLAVGFGERVCMTRLIAHGERQVRYLCDGVERRRVAFVNGDAVHVALDAVEYVVTEGSAFPSTAAADDPTRLVAPLSGVVSRLMVELNAEVSEGDAVLSIEAMKMETRVLARAQGRLARLHVVRGERVEAGTLLAELTLDKEGRRNG